MASAVLERAHFVSQVCDDMGSLVDELLRGAGAIMLAEEVLVGPALAVLTGALAAQPPWSDGRCWCWRARGPIPAPSRTRWTSSPTSR